MPSIHPETHGGLNSHTSAKVNGAMSNTNGIVHSEVGNDTFQRLPKQQQDVLVLHGPRQKYSLKTTGEVPELRSERELLIQARQYIKSSDRMLTSAGCLDWFEPSGLEGTVSDPLEGANIPHC